MTVTARLDAVLQHAQNRGLIGPGSVASHRRHAESFLHEVPDGAATGVDLGTGGGLPGLVVAMHRPDMRWVFVESSTARAAFLRGAVATLDLGFCVTVRTERAEQVGRSEVRGTFDLVTARSFGPPAVVAECAAPLLRVGGRLVVSEPPAVEVSDRWPAASVAQFGLGPPRSVSGPPRLVVLEQVGPCPDLFPRRTGQPAKRPAF